MEAVIGKPMDRVDGRAKVTGAARFSTEPPVQGASHGVIVQSTIARGKITAIDSASVERLPGVLGVMTHLNAPKIKPPTPNFMTGGIFAESRLPLSDDQIHHAGQHIAVVVATTLEQAKHAAAMLKVTYAAETPVVSMDDPAAKVVSPPDFFGEKLQDGRGDIEAAFADDNSVIFSATYTTPPGSHNPMEVSNTTAVWEEEKLTVYDSTQWLSGTAAVLAEAFGVPRTNVRVICPYVGGGFGCKGFIWPHTLLAAMAARLTGRPVKLVLSRAQQFTSCGHRPATRQVVSLAATKAGKLTGIRHLVDATGQAVSQYVEPAAMGTSRLVYDVPNVRFTHNVRQVDIASPTFMRAPGEAPGTFALECAMDELAYALEVDPLQLRLANLPREKAPHSGLPWSSYHLDECLTQAAEKFGWAKRDPAVKSMREGRLMIGQGLAVATFPGSKFGGACKVRLFGDGRLLVSTAAHDLGTGAYTAFTQIAAHEMGIAVERVRVEMGDSNLPPGPIAGGSCSTATVSQMIHAAVASLKKKLSQAATSMADSPLKGLKLEEMEMDGEGVRAKGDASRRVTIAEIVTNSGKSAIEADGTAMPGAEMGAYAFHSFGAQFVEVAIDPLDPRVQVRRCVAMFDAGRIVNSKLAYSQLAGGIVWGIGMALTEETHWDHRTGRCTTDNLADYAVAVNADIPKIDVMWTDKPDPHFNPLGVRGIGEIGITGVAAAIGNAVYHATGVRVRDLPIVPGRLV
ncbi:MAG TPA: xanthine dehydrogenase family protein molybdopterin-binding subunit [Tepidisphaeraceae bacterium]|nr:xanthine dehydrogenase family protein molybdopterin-binding subunit [Tepidisphaeraceae bacterium]